MVDLTKQEFLQLLGMKFGIEDTNLSELEKIFAEKKTGLSETFYEFSKRMETVRPDPLQILPELAKKSWDDMGDRYVELLPAINKISDLMANGDPNRAKSIIIISDGDISDGIIAKEQIEALKELHPNTSIEVALLRRDEFKHETHIEKALSSVLSKDEGPVLKAIKKHGLGI